MINPGAIPSIPGDMDVLATHASQLSRTGGDFSHTGEQVNHTWQGLAGVYRAPEAGQLFAATAPVQSISASVGTDIQAAGRALGQYAAEVKQIQARLTALRAQAGAFVDSVHGQDDWQSDSGKVNENNQLIDAVSTQMAAFFDAQRRCANAINALYGGTQYQADNGDGQLTGSEYGYTATQLTNAAHQGASLPWGSDEKHDTGFWGDVGGFFGGMWDGAKQTVTGLGALIGYGDGHFSWSTAGTAWKGLGKFALAAGVYAMPAGLGIGLDQTVGIPGFKRGELGQTLATAGKGLVAWDEWGKDPARAAGTATFNVVTAIVGTKGAGAALKGAGTAAEASDLATIAKAGTVLSRGGDLLTKMPTVSDLAGKAFGKLPLFHLPEINPEAHIPEHVDTPHTPPIPDTHPGSVGDGLHHSPHLPETPHQPEHVGAPHIPNEHPTDTTPTSHEHPTHNQPTAHHDPTGDRDPHGQSPGGGDHTPGGHGHGDEQPKLIRQDNDFHSEHNDKGQQKSHLDAAGDLVPANPDGKASILEHIVGRDPMKSDSPFTSLSREGATPKDFGRGYIRVDLPKLSHDIAAGRVHGVEIYSPQHIQDTIQANADHIAGRHVDIAVPHRASNQDIRRLAESFRLDKTATNELQQRIKDMRNTQRDEEWLIRGIIPHEYIEGPFTG